MEQAGVELAQGGGLAAFHAELRGARWPQVDTARQELGSVHERQWTSWHLPWAQRTGKSWKRGKGGEKGGAEQPPPWWEQLQQGLEGGQALATGERHGQFK